MKHKYKHKNKNKNISEKQRKAEKNKEHYQEIENIRKDMNEKEKNNINNNEKFKNINGRPTLYKEEYCEELIKWMSEGKSFWSFASQIPCSLQTIADWTKKYPAFLESKTIGKSLELSWWDNVHRRCAATGEGNSTLIVWAQKNKFPKLYKERLAKQDVKHQININGSMDFKQLIATMDKSQIEELVKAITVKVEQIEKEGGK